MKAVVLAAGRGERLRPLTDRVPKALVPAGGRPLIDWHLERLAAAGFTEVIVNLAHLGDSIAAFAGDGSRWGISIVYSREPEPLETAGALAFARALIGPSPHLLVNADIWCDFDLARLRRRLDPGLAHLVLVDNPPHNPRGDFTLEGNRAGDPARDTRAPRYTYAGIGIVSPALCADVPSGSKAPLGPLMVAAAAGGLVSGEHHPGSWHDAGTLERLARLEDEIRARSPSATTRQSEKERR